MNRRVKQEIKHFTALEHIWHGQMTEAGQRRYDNKAALFKKMCNPTRVDKILEIGCGDGIFTQRLRGTDAQIMATDITPAVVSRSKAKLSFPGLKYKIEDCEKLSFKEGSFSIVCGVSILHHVEIKKTIQECYRVLRNGGKLFFTEPNYLNPIIFLFSNVGFLRKVMELSPNEKALFRKDVEKLLKSTGFRKVVVRNYDFLLPWAPRFMISFLEKIGDILEKLPLVKEISGSLLIYAEK